METPQDSAFALNYQFGDPFADVGAAVLQKLLAQHPGWQERDALKFATDVYVRNWQGKLAHFFTNSTISNPAKNGKPTEQTEGTLRYYGKMLDTETAARKGWCRLSGKYEPLFSVGRESQMLVGSGAFVNFHHGFEAGMRLSGKALLDIFLTPLGCINVSGKVALLHSNQCDIIELIATNNLKANLRPSTSELEPGLAKSLKGNASNAIFAYVDDILMEVKSRVSKLDTIRPTSLTLYLFTNWGPAPEMVIHHLSATVFDFYQQVMSAFKEPWTWFVRAHYRSSKFKGARARPDTMALLLPGKPHEAPTVVEPATYQAWSNNVYLRLLQGQSLLPLIRAWSRSHPFPFDLTAYYCEKILNMDRKTLELIAQVARYIATAMEDSAIKRTLTRLSTARTGSEVRLLLVGLQRRNYESDATEPLLRLDDYVRYLFPDGTSWREIRDLLLISLYEQLHENNRHVELEEGLEEVAANDDNDTDNA